MLAGLHAWSPWSWGLAVGLGAGAAYFPLATSLVVLVSLTGAAAYAIARNRPSILVLELPVCLLLGATLIFRVRDASSLESDPLDAAGLYRIAFIGLAGLLSGVALLRSPSRHVGIPFRLYVAYVLSAFIAVPLSIYPALTLYRGIELLVCVLVVVTAWRFYGIDGIDRVVGLLVGFMAVLLVSVWFGVIFFRELAVTPIAGPAPLPFRIQGAIPVLSANGVGTFASLLFLWSLVKSRWLFASFALVTLLASQYRTGYVIVLVGFLVWLMVHRRYALAWAGLVLCLAAGLIFPSLVSAPFESAQALVLRGESTEMVATLTGRTTWWSAALEVWKESPIVGKGLLTATRFEALNVLGLSTTSTIHNAWIEALVGTGGVGFVLLACSYFFALWWARTNILFFLFLLALGLRTITGSSFETFGVGALLFACLSVSGHPSPIRRSKLDSPKEAEFQ